MPFFLNGKVMETTENKTKPNSKLTAVAKKMRLKAHHFIARQYAREAMHYMLSDDQVLTFKNEPWIMATAHIDNSLNALKWASAGICVYSLLQGHIISYYASLGISFGSYMSTTAQAPKRFVANVGQALNYQFDCDETGQTNPIATAIDMATGAVRYTDQFIRQELAAEQRLDQPKAKIPPHPGQPNAHLVVFFENGLRFTVEDMNTQLGSSPAYKKLMKQMTEHGHQYHDEYVAMVENTERQKTTKEDLHKPEDVKEADDYRTRLTNFAANIGLEKEFRKYLDDLVIKRSQRPADLQSEVGAVFIIRP